MFKSRKCSKLKIFGKESNKSKLQFEVLWVTTPCSILVGYRRFRGPCCLHLQGWNEDGGSMDLWNVGILPQHNTASQPSRSRSMDLWNVGILPQHYTASQLRKPRRENLQLHNTEDSRFANNAFSKYVYLIQRNTPHTSVHVRI